MALYDYKCDGCGLRFEQDHPMSAPPVKVCPECGAEKVRKILSTGGIQVSGSRSVAPPPSMPCGSGGCGGGMCGIG
ncbi:MAG: zinc ribbon domain-containing protein [Magnetococcales bacterium]|nr:zinc ribbon domain-containing protein [Magnetococcales bacterium]MBF0262737.1 zinc ribbon domain-containing protein [Magnetococcales bacterium]